MEKDLIRLEERGWQALSREGEHGKRFYEEILRDDAVMAFPGGMLIVGKRKILESLAGQPWESFRIEEPRVLPLTLNAGVVVYRVSAQRGRQEPYAALVSSAYALDGETWKLVFHQQTPV